MAFVALASAALFIGTGGTIKGIWSTMNSQLVVANSQGSLGHGEGHAGALACSARSMARRMGRTRNGRNVYHQTMGRRVAARVTTEQAGAPDWPKATGVDWRD